MMCLVQESFCGEYVGMQYSEVVSDHIPKRYILRRYNVSSLIPNSEAVKQWQAIWAQERSEGVENKSNSESGRFHLRGR